MPIFRCVASTRYFIDLLVFFIQVVEEGVIRAIATPFTNVNHNLPLSRMNDIERIVAVGRSRNDAAIRFWVGFEGLVCFHIFTVTKGWSNVGAYHADARTHEEVLYESISRKKRYNGERVLFVEEVSEIFHHFQLWCHLSDFPVIGIHRLAACSNTGKITELFITDSWGVELKLKSNSTTSQALGSLLSMMRMFVALRR